LILPALSAASLQGADKALKTGTVSSRGLILGDRDNFITLHFRILEYGPRRRGREGGTDSRRWSEIVEGAANESDGSHEQGGCNWEALLMLLIVDFTHCCLRRRPA
jgi:hypothetical protein